MGEFDEATMNKMADTIESCLESGNCANGVPLSKEAFELMYALAMGVCPVIGD